MFFLEEMTTNNVVAELNKGIKLNGNNYDIWYHKVQNLLELQDSLEVITNIMTEPPKGNTTQHKKDHEAYGAWKIKNRSARILLLSTMEDDFMCEYEEYHMAHQIWNALKEKYGGTSTTKLRRLTIKFDTYKLRPNTLMEQHLREMSLLIRELKNANSIITDEQQVQVVIRSLPDSWEHMKVNMTHNESVKMFKDIQRHLELEDERLEAAKSSAQLYTADTNSRKSSGFQRKRGGKISSQSRKKSDQGQFSLGKCKRGKRTGKKKDMSKVTCYNCSKLGHFARDCTEPKKVHTKSTNLHNMYVIGSVYMTETHPLWIVDSRATEHVANERGAYVEYRRFNQGTKWIYVGNSSRVEVKGIGTCKLQLHGGQILYLHNICTGDPTKLSICHCTSEHGISCDIP